VGLVAAADLDLLVVDLERLLLVVVDRGAVGELLQVEVLRVAGDVRRSPGDARGSADHDARRERQRHAGDIELGRREVALEPDRRHADRDVRIVRQ
jgi:hypothetical protein